MRGYHDLGGLADGAIDRSEHDYAPWEKRVHAILLLLTEKGVMTVDELRHGIETLGADHYDRLTYYERWIASIANTLIDRGAITVDELGRKLAEVETHAAGEA